MGEGIQTGNIILLYCVCDTGGQFFKETSGKDHEAHLSLYNHLQQIMNNHYFKTIL